MQNFSIFRQHTPVDDFVQAINKDISAWDVITLRQDYPGTAHKDTKSIIFRGPVPGQDAFNSLESIEYPAWDTMLGGFAEEYADYILDAVDAADVGRVMLVKLKPNGHITAHIDEGAYANQPRFRRFHLVLSGSCNFRVGKEIFHPVPGDIFWFNHHLEHEVINPHDVERIHFIVDAIL